MAEFLKKLLTQIKGAMGKMEKKQKIIIAVVMVVVLGALFLAVSSSSEQSVVYLFKNPVSADDYAKITKKLAEYGANFKTKDDRFILVKDEATGARLRMQLGQDNLLPTGIKGWELFDTEKWTTTDFERNVMKRRAIIGSMIRHLKMLEDVEDVQLTVSMPDASLYMQSDEPWKASVTIIAKPFSDLYKNEQKIKGIINLVANGIDKLKPENIVVTDNKGNILSDFSKQDSVDYLVRSQMEYRMKEQFRQQLEVRIRERLKKVLGSDRFDMTMKYELDFDQTKIQRDLIIPTVIKKDNPNTPWDETEVTLNTPVSSQTIDETFKGPTYIPEGPAGVQNNIPPGLKEKINRFSHYNKKQNTVNYRYSTEKVDIKKQPVSIKKIAVAAWIDGMWDKVYKGGDLVVTDKGTIKRTYTPVSDDDLMKIDAIIKSAIGYTPARGDQVVVKHLQFDRRAQFDTEDEEIRKRERIRKTLIAAVGALFVLFLGTMLWRAVSKEIARRKRIREEELALQQQRMREQALRAAEEEGVEVELSLEEKARLEMQENAINMARERPEEVAQLLRTWLLEE